MTKDRWLLLMRAFGILDEGSTYDAICKSYGAHHRHYHTNQHIECCLRELDDSRGLANDPAEVELALWFHDAIYNPMSSANEEKSADWACAFLKEHAAATDRIQRVRAHIVATQHLSAPVHSDSKLVVDIDLAILGADQDRYAQFEDQVRQEYRWVPTLIFKSKRAAILQSFLNRPRIYHHDRFIDLYETAARQNLVAAIAALGA
jgi:predicted metal-dependent HD superfamily phosphohydrolase